MNIYRQLISFHLINLDLCIYSLCYGSAQCHVMELDVAVKLAGRCTLLELLFSYTTSTGHYTELP